ncbi:hypothetical protein CU254_04580 [Amycolatopsis sp. AA4]|uniref:hypothetical protein n=1 Tax=Actinomycetes TaxID=1760 RepID=UPI0001B57A0C|nr:MULTISPECIES: hypothetical protein [Actinomycetes]ATY09817.1 hypothetical protein CU254_04580 [Amycolatopsis sp. AA4]EFL05218.1 predicted protein [Streptomyces sp. AA4]
MNDFVDRLLGRIDAPPIRPLVPTLFEPSSPVGAEPELPMGTFTETAPKPGAAKETEHVREVSLPERVERIQESPVLRTESVERVREVPMPVVESRTHTDRETVFNSERSTESLLEREVRTEHSERETVSQPVPAAEPESFPEPPESSRAALERVVETVRAHPVARPQPERIPPSQPPPLPIRRHNAPAEPDVHISIGRVEVTARPAPGPAPKPRQERKPLLSLDDYLRERG